MKKKICFAITSITDNGVTRVVSILLDEIDYEKYDVSVLLTRKRPHKYELNPKARILEVSQDLDAGKLKNIIELHRILKRERFDQIIALGDYAAMYVLLACFGIKVRKIVSERNDPNREPDKKAFRKLRDILYRSVDVIVCQTRDAENYFDGIVPKRVIIPNPIRAGLPVSSGNRDKRIVNFCRIDSQKNLPLLVSSFKEFYAQHQDYTLEIYGNGPLEAEIRDFIARSEMEHCVKLHDFCLDIHERIKDAAMFVSSSDFEGMSNSMLEALAIGIPTICTDCPIGGAREVIQSGVNGWLVPVNDRKSLTEAMTFVAEHPEEAAQAAGRGTEIRNTLSRKRIADMWWEVIG